MADTHSVHPVRSDQPTRLRSLPLAVACAVLLGACGQAEQPGSTPGADAQTMPQVPAEAAAAVEEMAAGAAAGMGSAAALAEVLAGQPEAVQARYIYRHPAETLAFFGIEPGMTVLEALPGGGWYTKILVPYLGPEGTLVGVDYDKAMFPLFGFYDEETIASKETWPADWTARARGWFDGDVATIEAYQFGAMPDAAAESLDAALFVRALHNMARFEAEGGFLSTALEETFAALKPGGIVGVVQHMAPEDAPDAWASGAAGYLKKSYVIDRMTAAGFELVDESSVNENPADQPTTDDVVWRLPPTLSGTRDDPEKAAPLLEIGESSRMTLKFRKPA